VTYHKRIGFLIALLLLAIPLTASHGLSAPSTDTNLAPAATTAQGAWQRVWRGDGVVNALVGLDAQTIIGVGSSGMIINSSNGGDTWHYQSPVPTADLYDLAIQGGSMWAVGDTGLVIGSQDGGASWRQQAIGSANRLVGVSFSNSSNGWVVGDGGEIWQTTDGGATWAPQTSGVNSALLAVAAADDGLHGFAAGANGVLLKTADGGATWTPITGLIPTSTQLQDIALAGSHVWAVGSDGRLYHSSDTGDTWAVLANIGVALDEIEFAPGQDQIGWVAGPDGRVGHTSDGGVTWKLSSASPGWDLSALGAGDNEHVWAAGSVIAKNDGNWSGPTQMPSWFMWRTRDGNKWEHVIGGHYPRFFSIKAASDQVAYAVGDHVVALKTTDGGNTWREIAQEFRDNPDIAVAADTLGSWLMAIDCAPDNPDDCTAVGRGGLMVHTLDGGATWRREFAPGYSGFLYDVNRTTDNKGIATGTHHYFYTTNNRFWSESQPVIRTTGVDLDMINENVGVVAILKTSAGPRYTLDGGQTWGHRPPLSDYAGWFLHAIDAYDVDANGALDNVWYAGCYRPGSWHHEDADYPCVEAGILHSQDGGFTWEDYRFTGVNSLIYSIQMVDESTGWAVGRDGFLAATEDGATWTVLDVPAAGDLWSVNAWDRTLVYAAGDGQTILRFAKPDRRFVADPQGVTSIDGDLSEWTSTFQRSVNASDADTISGETPDLADLNADVRVRWDDNALYFGLHIDDSDVLTQTGQLDQVGVAIDGLQDGLIGADDVSMLFGADGSLLVGGQPAPAGWQWAVQTHATGYDIEARIPATAVGANFEHLRKLGINIALYDRDTATAPAAQQNDVDTDLIWAGSSLDADPATFGELALFQFDRQQPTLPAQSVGPRTLDGDVSEWAGQPAVSLTAASADSVQGQPVADDADLSATWRWGWWSDTLLLAVSVQDNAVGSGDAVLLSFDPSADQRPGSDDFSVSISADGLVQSLGGPTTGIVAAGQHSATGYDLEIAIPAALFGGELHAHQQLRFNFGLQDDDDNDGQPERYLNWQGASVTGVQADFGTLDLQPLTMLLKAGDGQTIVQDTLLDEWNPARNYGTLGHLWIHSSGARNSLIRFDLSALPADAKITQATLRLNVYEDQTAPLQTHLYRMLQAWEERQATWQQATSGQAWDAPGALGAGDRAATSSADVPLAAVGDFTEWNVTADVQDFATGNAANYGWQITGDASANQLYKLVSSDWNEPERLPELSLEYTLPGGTVPTPTHAYRYPDRHAHGHRHAYIHPPPHIHTHANGDTFSHAHGDGHAHGYGDPYAHTGLAVDAADHTVLTSPILPVPRASHHLARPVFFSPLPLPDSMYFRCSHSFLLPRLSRISVRRAKIL